MATVTTRLGPHDHGRRMTLEEFRAADPEEGYRYELSRGVVEVTRVPGTRHGQVVSNLYCAAAYHRADHPQVILRYGGGSEGHLWMPAIDSGRNPDFVVVLRPPPGVRDKDPRPSLAAEVVSARSGHRDYVLKREEYLVYGLAEYWIVDFLARRMTFLVRDGDAWREQVLVGDQVIPSVVLPGLTTTVADLWADLDFYDEDGEDESEEIDPAGLNQRSRRAATRRSFAAAQR